MAETPEWRKKLNAWKGPLKRGGRSWQVFACVGDQFEDLGYWSCELFFGTSTQARHMVRSSYSIEDAVTAVLTAFHQEQEAKRAKATKV